MGHTEPLQEQGLAKEGAEDQGDTDILAPQGDYCEEERGQKGSGQAAGGPDGGKRLLYLCPHLPWAPPGHSHPQQQVPSGASFSEAVSHSYFVLGGKGTGFGGREQQECGRGQSTTLTPGPQHFLPYKAGVFTTLRLCSLYCFTRHVNSDKNHIIGGFSSLRRTLRLPYLRHPTLQAGLLGTGP